VTAHPSRVRLRALGLGLALGAASLELRAETVVEDGVVTRMEAAPKRLQGIDVEEHLDRVLPLDLEFRNSAGERVALSRYVTGQRPVIFTLNYSDCPMLCSLQLSGLSAAVGRLDRRLGTDYDIVTISLDPKETSQRAGETEARYRSEVAQAGSASGWTFLTGSAESIEQIAESLGIRYAYNAERKEYVHPAALILSTPSGRISRYLYGIEYHQKTLSLSLVEAAEGKIGSSVDRFILYCFHYDESEGRYAPMAMNIMRVGGSATAIALGGFLGAFWLRQGQKRGTRGRAARASAKASSATGLVRDDVEPRG
jgi:protein SCO1/2